MILPRASTHLNPALERSFSCARPTAWNSLPSAQHELTDTQTVKRQLKTFIFQQARQPKERMYAVLKPTFYVVLFCIAFTILTFNFCLLGLSLSV